MTSTAPRAVFVTRESDYQLLLARHATREQARFYLEPRGQKFSELETRHERFQAVLRQARAAVPTAWPPTPARSEEPRAGHSCVRPCRYRWSPSHYKKTIPPPSLPTHTLPHYP